MAFSAQEINNAFNAVLQYYQKGPAIAQSIQDKPLLKALDSKKKTFSGGNQYISIPVKGKFTTTIQGYNTTDVVQYANPANILRANYLWKEIHAGVTLTETELKINGQSVTDENGKSIDDHSGRDMQILTDLLEDKLNDMTEGYARGMNSMLWLDGTQDSKQVAGIRSLITDTPTVGTTGGIDRASNTWWQNQAAVGAGLITSNTSTQALTNYITTFYRQLRRFASKKNMSEYICLGGSTFLDKLIAELRAKGYNSMDGWSSSGKTDITVADISYKGLGDFTYDPSLDDLGFPDRCYFIDLNAIKLQPMQDEENKMRYPARPYNQYVLYRAMTWTGTLTANQLNTSGVIQTA